MFATWLWYYLTSCFSGGCWCLPDFPTPFPSVSLFGFPAWLYSAWLLTKAASLLTNVDKTYSHHTEGHPPSFIYFAAGSHYGALFGLNSLCRLSWPRTQSRAVVSRAFNPSTWEAEAGESLWVWGQPCLQELVPEQLGLLHRETLSQKTNKQKEMFTTLNPQGNANQNYFEISSYPFQNG